MAVDVEIMHVVLLVVEVDIEGKKWITKLFNWKFDRHFRCTTCHGSGHVRCNICNGHGALRYHLQLKVLWYKINENQYWLYLIYLIYLIYRDNHIDEYISDRSEVPEKIIKKVTGNIVFDDRQPRVYPITDFPDSAIAQASTTFIGKHNQFPTERILEQVNQILINKLFNID